MIFLLHIRQADILIFCISRFYGRFIATAFIYIGLQKKNPEYNKIGFALIGIMVVKLYAYDVWQMDNISRIIAFIILGIILLLSSFMFQRLKNIITNFVDKKENQDENIQS